MTVVLLVSFMLSTRLASGVSRVFFHQASDPHQTMPIGKRSRSSSYDALTITTNDDRSSMQAVNSSSRQPEAANLSLTKFFPPVDAVLTNNLEWDSPHLAEHHVGELSPDLAQPYPFHQFRELFYIQLKLHLLSLCVHHIFAHDERASPDSPAQITFLLRHIRIKPSSSQPSNQISSPRVLSAQPGAIASLDLLTLGILHLTEPFPGQHRRLNSQISTSPDTTAFKCKDIPYLRLHQHTHASYLHRSPLQLDLAILILPW
jgi:hypothetical protein